ncbi:rhomboid family intramembrane serine protease [Anaerorhabdus furcosa]|uniref:Membrane associated serine protease, rhomboid family n=1 Tax=Anaerorhabdus furcosa TaxID=118967 RepID=A0A1T4QDF8_9FIRM|nr:rhomboid family intramembrane serine protease [Anaerorhabdus furcosa]SKA01840.1 Membrane associated serine protease, rhomboid family [Anaerorhabdus furcosa]
MALERDLILMKLAQYFVTKYQYKFVDIKQNNHEIWLGSNHSDEYPVIRISLTNASAATFEKSRLLETSKAICDFFHKNAKLLDIHVSDELIETSEEEFIQVGITDDKITGVDITNTFPDFQNAVLEIHKFKENQTPQTPFDTFNPARKTKRSIKDMPYITYAIGLICALVFVITNLIAYNNGNDAITASIVMGAYYKAFIVGGHEFFRLLTVGFVHYDLFHFLMNMAALVSLGQICERIYKKWQFIVIILGSILTGSLFIFAAQGNVLTVGLSGGLYGLMAALLVYGFDSKVIYNPAVAKSFLSTLLINLLITFMPGVSMYGHIGGFIGGLFLSVLFTQNKAWKLLRQNAIIAGVMLLGILGYQCVQNYNVKPIYYGTDKAVLDYLDSVGLSGYSNNMKNKLNDFYGFDLTKVK